MIIDQNVLAHYGILRKSGRYPWGSGGNQDARNKGFLQYVQDLSRQGISEKTIAEGIGISTTQLRAYKSMAKHEVKQQRINQAQRLKDKGVSDKVAAEQMGIPGTTYRALLAPGAKDRNDILITTASILKDRVDQDKFIDIGSGSETYVNVSAEKLRTAATILQEQGYKIHTVNRPQVGRQTNTKVKVLCPPGTTWGEAQRNVDKVQLIRHVTFDGGRSYSKIKDPLPLSARRVGIKYKEEGGDLADGMIYVRPGVPDVSIGENRYAQVRVQVGSKHYIKGMAMYKDDLPDGIDVMFYTNKSSSGNKYDAMKELENDPDLPFGSIISRQILKDEGTPKERVTSTMNIVNEQGRWGDWSKNISAQALSKQTPAFAKERLDETYEIRKRDLEEILTLNNPTVKKKLLETFADDADSAAAHLKAAALPKSRWHVILPVPKLAEGEIYATGYNNGERVALIRYPHGGRFEIPDLVVNNKNREAKKLLGEAPDAVGIHPSVAKRLSGADFDGDTVLVIPNNNKKIKHEPALEGLKDFDPRSAYPLPKGASKLTSSQKQHLMGDVSNLITDMTIKNASHEKIARAVRHSMAIIDAEKHPIDWKESERQNGIRKLKEEFQMRPDGRVGGAATLISRARSPKVVNARRPRYAKEGGPLDAEGRKVWVETGKMREIPGRVTKTGKVIPPKLVPVTIKSTKMAETNDAHLLSSGTPMEKVYADYANSVKSLANRARLEAAKPLKLKSNSSAKKAYAREVDSLDAKLHIVKANRPLERQAQAITRAIINAKKAANPHLEKSTIKKLEYKQLDEVRRRLKVGETQVKFTNEEWNAIQAGAISDAKLRQLLDKSDIKKVRERATPRSTVLMSPANTRRAHSLLADGYTRAEAAAKLGVSVTTLDRALTGDDDED